jgi:hypothetical protein
MGQRGVVSFEFRWHDNHLDIRGEVEKGGYDGHRFDGAPPCEGEGYVWIPCSKQDEFVRHMLEHAKAQMGGGPDDR